MAERSREFETGTAPASDTCVNLQSIADSLGTSIRTVLRALNDPDKVGETTPRRVLDACESFGYVPNLLARSLASKRSGLVAALVPPFADTTFHETLHVFSSSLAEYHYRFLISHGGGQAYEARAIDTLLGLGRQQTGIECRPGRGGSRCRVERPAGSRS